MVISRHQFVDSLVWVIKEHPIFVMSVSVANQPVQYGIRHKFTLDRIQVHVVSFGPFSNRRYNVSYVMAPLAKPYFLVILLDILDHDFVAMHFQPFRLGK